jgi:cathepsin L
MRAVFVAIALVSLCVLAMVVEAKTINEKEYQTLFSAFVKKHNKNYAHDEFFHRYQTFKANYNKIRAHNMGSHTYTLGVNEFADMTGDEFKAKYTGLKPRNNALHRSLNAPVKLLGVEADESIDWRTKGAVTDVKNQQQCGSCWSFSTTGSVEGAHAIKTGQLVSLSEQQLVDCSAAEGDQGCNGGLMDDAFQFIITNKGICLESDYPYTAAQGTCQTSCKTAATISSFKDVTAGDETALMAALQLGPVSIAIEADQQVFQLYTGGIISDPSCGQQLDHGVLLVGAGTDDTTTPPTDYWIVKNSWGGSWGESGYVRLARGKNECGLSNMASYPVV